VSVTVGGYPCSNTRLTIPYIEIRTIVPAGVGTLPLVLSVRNSVGEVITTEHRYHYLPPTIDAATATSTEGGVVVVTGSNFGSSSHTISVRLNRLEHLRVLRMIEPHCRMEVLMPPTIGNGPYMLSVAVCGLVATKPLDYRYKSPVIRRISLQQQPIIPVGDEGFASHTESSNLSSASTTQLMWLILSGENFGGAGTDIAVFVCGLPALHVSLVREHTRVQCKLPPRTPAVLTSRDVVLRINGVSCQAVASAGVDVDDHNNGGYTPSVAGAQTVDGSVAGDDAWTTSLL
jgi:hypothetical protein